MYLTHICTDRTGREVKVEVTDLSSHTQTHREIEICWVTACVVAAVNAIQEKNLPLS